jgi:hypothetical protein
MNVRHKEQVRYIYEVTILYPTMHCIFYKIDTNI